MTRRPPPRRGSCSPRGSTATSGCATAGSRSSRCRAPRRSAAAAGCCPAWSTRTATSVSAPAACHIEDLAAAREQALTERAAGVLALRDCGSPVDTRALDDEPDLPRIIRAGRQSPPAPLHPRSRGRGEPGDLVGRGPVQARRGDGWVKLVGDWIDRGRRRPRPRVAGRRARRGDRRGPRGGRPGHRAHLRHRRAARPDRRRASTASSTARG